MTLSVRDTRQRVLWKLACAGHAPSFRRLHRELSGPVLRYLTARLGRGADAEDVASEVFRKFVVSLRRYDPERGSLEAWVFTMARSALVDHLRRKRPMQSLDDVVETLADDRPDGLDRLVADEEARFAHGLLQRYPAVVREMFALHFAHGLSYRDIAATLGMSEAAVKQRFARTLRDLRQRLGTHLDTKSTGKTPRSETSSPRGTIGRSQAACVNEP